MPNPTTVVTTPTFRLIAGTILDPTIPAELVEFIIDEGPKETPNTGTQQLCKIDLLSLLSQVKLFPRERTAWGRIWRWLVGPPNPLLPSRAIWRHGKLAQQCDLFIGRLERRVYSQRTSLNKALQHKGGGIKKQCADWARARIIWYCMTCVWGVMIMPMIIMLILTEGSTYVSLAVIGALGVLGLFGAKANSIAFASKEALVFEQAFVGRIPQAVEAEIRLADAAGFHALLLTTAHWAWTAADARNQLPEYLVVYRSKDRDDNTGSSWYRGRFKAEQ